MSQSSFPAGSGAGGDHLRGVLLAAGGMLLISPDGLAFRLVSADDLQILFWRGLFGCAALALYLQATRPGGFAAALRRGGRPGLLSALLIAAGTAFFVASITRTTVANTLVILSTVPLFAALLGWLILRERVGARTWLAIAACICGILLIFSGSLGGGSLLGDLLALGAALCIAANLVVIRANRATSLLPSLALAGLLTAVAASPFIDAFNVSARDLAAMAGMGIVFQALAFSMFLAAGRYLPPGEVGLFALVETVLGPLWAWIGVGEIPASNAVIGGTIVIATLAVHSALVLRRPRRAAAIP